MKTFLFFLLLMGMAVGNWLTLFEPSRIEEDETTFQNIQEDLMSLIKKTKEQARKEAIDLAQKLIETANNTATKITKDAQEDATIIIQSATDTASTISKEAKTNATNIINEAETSATTIIKEANDTAIQIIKEAKDTICRDKESSLKQFLFVAAIGCLVLGGGLIVIQTRYSQTKNIQLIQEKKLEQTEKQLTELQRKISGMALASQAATEQ
jgi:hypothetical protein